MELLKDESLSPKFDLSTFITNIKSISDLQATVEAKYVEKTKEE